MATKAQYAEWCNQLAQYAEWCNQLVEGDDVLDELYAALHEDGFTDEDGFWIYSGEEE